MSEFATQSSNEQCVGGPAPQTPWDEEYERMYGTSYAAEAPSGNVDPTYVTSAVGHYAEDPAATQEKFDKDVERHASGFDLIGRAIDVAGYAFGDGTREVTERVGSAFAVPGDAVKAAKGIRDGNASDAFTGGAGVVADVAGVLGVTPAAVVAGEAKAYNEYRTGQDEIEKGNENDNGLMTADGIRHTLDGIADSAGAIPERHVAGVGKALGFGMAVGDAIAPTLMGDKNISSDVQKSDGTFVPSTGNRAFDWVLGEGKFSDSRFDSDGVSGEERASAAKADADFAQANADYDHAIETASPEDREYLEEQRRIIEGMTGVRLGSS